MLSAKFLPGLNRINEDGSADDSPGVDAAATSEKVRAWLQSLPAYFHGLLSQDDPAEPFVFEHEDEYTSAGTEENT